MVRLNSPTLDTTKLPDRYRDTPGYSEGREAYLVPSSVQLINWEDFGSLIILWTYVIVVSE